MFTVLPASVIRDVRTFFWVVEEVVWWPSEVLLSVRVVAHAPVVDLRVVDGTERCLVAVQHELLKAEDFLKMLKI